MKKIISVLFAIFAFTMPAIACESNEIDTGSACIESKFSVTTSETDVFKFTMSASGTFYIDCGNDGILTSTADDVSDKTVVRSNTDNATYTCTWQSADSQTIHFAGSATGYSSSVYDGCIVFGTRTPNNSVLRPDLITNISGSLGEIFKSYGRNDTRYPSFFAVFANANALTSLPAGLFSGVKTATFLFAFEYCGNLIEIPENLFSDLSGQPVNGAFSYTFHNCVRLQNIPEKLFKGVPYLSYNLFYATFYGCTALKNIPSGLFSHIKDSTATTNGNAFRDTFSECYRLTSLPEDLFASITTAAQGLFQNTFKYCSHITGYIPPSAFRGLITNNSPTATDMWLDTFSGTQLDTTCPAGTTEFDTGYKTIWGGKVSCYESTPQTCAAGEYLPRYYDSCAICPSGSACSGGTYSFNETTNQGIVACASGTFAPTESAVCYPHILHVGDSNVYLKSTKQTTPSLNIKIGNDVFYANMTTERTRMSKDSSHYLHVKTADNIHYYVCDDTVCPQ